VLERPFFHVHPCETSQVMTLTANFVANKQQRSHNYVAAWLSLVSAQVGLRALPVTFWSTSMIRSASSTDV